MARARVKYVCRECGAEQPAYLGRCPVCQAWSTLEEVIERPAPAAARESGGPRSGARVTAQPLAAVPSAGLDRIPIPIGEFNRVLGGGLVPGSAILFAGDPGIGKSTLLLDVAGRMPEAAWPVLYVSAEESPHQVKLRADRMGVASEHIYILPETDVDAAIEQADRLQPGLVIVDSIQTVSVEEIASSTGSVTQVRESASRLVRWAKARQTPVFLVGHVTKEGTVAGPRVLEHLVDAVLYLEGDRHHHYRILRGAKNRFGSTNEVGVFEMQETGLREVSNPSEAFLEERLPDTAGSVVAVTLEGTRPILVEVQALTAPTAYGQPRRMATGIDLSRLYLLTAVLSKRVGLPLGQQDVYLNVVGGLRINEPAIDLAAAVAIASSLQENAVEARTALVGEIGLSGELRSVSQLERRLHEAHSLGFTRVIIPATTRQAPKIPGLEVRKLASLSEAIQVLLVPTPGRQRPARRAEELAPTRRAPVMIPPLEELDPAELALDDLAVDDENEADDEAID
ncbi:MAG: DNA repair protein RadA [Chloroflexi bacterium]|nr:DNA repair protein RadA [Chloroflexota bacterium]